MPIRFVSGVQIRHYGVLVAEGTVDLQPTLDRIIASIPYPHPRDGRAFRNVEGRLPPQPNGYYVEYVHPTPGLAQAGVQRIVFGLHGEIYYTADHYQTFIRVD